MEKVIGLLALTGLLCTGCLKEELPVNFVPDGSVQEVQAEMSSDYRYQLYYNIEENAFVGQNEKTEWDFGIQLFANQIYIVANGSKLMRVANLGNVAFDAQLDTSGFENNARIESENVPAFQEPAFGDFQKGDLFLMDRGRGPAGEKFGFCKIKLTDIQGDKITLSVGSVEATMPERNIAVDAAEVMQFFNAESSTPVLVEPVDKAWDLTFTQYTTYFPEEDINYLVVGCLLNRGTTQAIQFEENRWEEIGFEDLQNADWSSERDILGYDWKHFDGSGFIVNSDVTYGVKTASGALFKLRFVGFYNDLGEKGFPKFEVVAY